MNYIDLHVHSNISDGTCTPSELVFLAIKNNLKAFALTDHDTTDGIEEAVNTAENYKKQGIDIEVIPGTELSVAYKDRDIHILGLFIDYKNPSLLLTLKDTVHERDNRNIKMCENLKEAGIDISLDKLKAEYPEAIITRAHFAKYLAQYGYVKNTAEAFTKYLNTDGPYYVNRKFLSPKEGIDLILSAGGIPVLAHPLLYKLPEKELDALIKQLKEYGLLGIEAVYSSNIGFDESTVRKLARKYDLLITGGSDFHGSNKPDLNMGTGRGNLKIPYTLLDELKNYKKQALK